MDHVYRLTDSGTSMIALALVVVISGATMLLLPRRDHAPQLFWVVPCLTLAAVEAVTDGFDFSAGVTHALTAAGAIVVSVALARRAQDSLGQDTSLPTTILVSSAIVLAEPIIHLGLGVPEPAATVLEIGMLLAACCWPMATPRIFACMKSHQDRLLLFILTLAYAIAALTPAFDEFADGSDLYYLEAALHFLGVVIGFVASGFALRGALHHNQLLAASERVARMAHEEAAGFLRGLIDNAPAGVYVKDLDGRYTLVNRLFSDWIDTPERKMLGSRDIDLFPLEVVDRIKQLDSQVIESAKPLIAEMPLRRQGDGVERIAINHKFPLFDAEGRVSGIAGLALDVTQSKEHERELVMARLRAEEANRAKSNFLAHMSHELRTPLNAIIGFSDVIHRGLFGPDKMELYQQYAGDIHRAGTLLLSQVNDLLDISRVEAGTFELSLKPLSLGDLALDCVHLLKDQAERKGVTLAIDSGRPLPKVMCDRRATLQVLINLVGNAIKYVPTNSTITIAGGRTESGVDYFLVEDNGPGLPTRVLQAMLDPWTHQSAVVTEDGRGGMGLLLSRKLMEVQGGRLVIESSPGKGTRVACQFAGAARDTGSASRSAGA
jgi:PAS domain S-box-containing protein